MIEIAFFEFDHTGSAILHFHGKIAEVLIHPTMEVVVPQSLLVCPNHEPSDKDCKFCAKEWEDQPLIKWDWHRRLALTWDHQRKRWVSFLSTSKVFAKIFDACKRTGAIPSLMENG